MMRGNHGHTLLELLVAVVMLALVAAGGYTGLDAVGKSHAAQRAELDLLEGAQWLVARLDRDLFHAIERPVRRAGAMQAALRGDSSGVSLTHAGLANPLQQARSNLQRVDWALTGAQLFRYSYPVLDGAVTAPAAELMLSGVTGLSFEFLDPGNHWLSSWPVSGGQAMPRAIRYRLQVEGFGEIERVVELPGPRQ